MGSCGRDISVDCVYPGMKYGVLGDGVNLAARLQMLNKRHARPFRDRRQGGQGGQRERERGRGGVPPPHHPSPLPVLFAFACCGRYNTKICISETAQAPAMVKKDYRVRCLDVVAVKGKNVGIRTLLGLSALATF